MRTRSMRSGGRSAGRSIVTRLGGHDAGKRAQGLVDELVEPNGRGAQLERAGFNAGHVQEVGNEAGQPVGLQLNGLEQLRTIGRPELGVFLAHARHGGLDRGQGGA